MEKNFKIIYENSDDMRARLNIDGKIDYNFTQAMFKSKIGKLSLNIFDDKTNPYESFKRGKCMIAYTFERLLFTFYGLNEESYNKLPGNDEKKDLPESMHYDWNEFKELYLKAFGTEIGSCYEIICSSGLQRI